MHWRVFRGYPTLKDFPMSQNTYLENIRLLIVDDNTFMRRVMHNILMAYGAKHIREASEGADALKMLRTWHADIILTDYIMHPIDGIELTHMIRTSNDVIDRFVPIIMVSAHSEEWRIALARDAGINEFLVKPLAATKVISHIRSIVEHPRKFVKSQRFLGPDRRRSQKNIDDEKRNAEPAVIAEPVFDDQHIGKHSYFYASHDKHAPAAPAYKPVDRIPDETPP